MVRNYTIGIATIVVILAAILGYAALRPAPVKAPATLATTATANALPAGGYVEHAAHYDIAVNYATTTPLAGEANDSALVLMRNYLGEIVAEFKNGINAISTDQGRKGAFETKYLIASSPHTISYIFTVYEDTLGAHGNTFFKTFTFDTSSGAPLALADVFSSGTPYLDTLSTMSRTKLPAIIGQNASADAIKSGTTPDEKNFENFFFDNRDFVILFPPYAVAAYSDGTQTLRIPLSELSNILKPEYQ